MAGYLDNYGAGEERRERIIKRTILCVVALLIVGGVLFFIFKNYREERQAKRFFELLESKNYQAAYTLWGCTEAKPCRDYPFTEFIKDWGPQGSHPDISTFYISKSRACGSGVILTIQFAKSRQEILWVEKDNLVIGYSPWPGCPAFR